MFGKIADEGAKLICNLYNLTTNQQAIRDIVGVMSDSLGNLEPSLDVYPDRPAPVIRNIGPTRELARLTWGMPTPPQFLKAPDAPDTGVTNIRNTASPHWRPRLGVAHRCIVPATAFSEYGARPDPVTKRKPLHWFALDETRPLFFFAGIWTSWQGTRGSMRTPRTGDHELFAFLTCEPNAVVGRVHPKAMPVILTEASEIETWLTADWSEARRLQRPLDDDVLIEVE
ncbi:SOS response-associated peptidase family protein [Cereibacter sp. SYSU M97828]|nr:SOS response-associated peptidase family protein [Cereibacter flavus]